MDRFSNISDLWMFLALWPSDEIFHLPVTYNNITIFNVGILCWDKAKLFNINITIDFSLHALFVAM